MSSIDELFKDIADRRWQETEVSRIIERFKQAGEITEIDIRGLKAGRDMNVLVAKYVLGHDVLSDETFGDMERLSDAEGKSIWAELTPYSEGLSEAQIVVEVMVDMGITGALFWRDYGDGIYPPAEAICKRALIFFLTDQKQEQ